MKDTIFASVKGKVKKSEPLMRHTTIRIGGPCDYWIEPADVPDLKKVLVICKKNRIPVFFIGKGGHLLVNDHGFRGAAIHLGAPSFKRIKVSGGRIVAGAGALLPHLIKKACEGGLGGLESLTGIPGTVGGAVFMNAGGWTSPLYETIGNFVESVKLMTLDGKIKRISRKNLSFNYRNSNVTDGFIIEVILRLKPSDGQALISQCRSFLNLKKDKQVLDAPSAGCIFKNPGGRHFTSGQLIDMMGLKGRMIGNAKISGKHANFIVNNGKASFRDVMALINLISREAKRHYGVSLELEVKIL